MVVYCWVIGSAINNFIFEGSDPRISAAKAESVLKAYQRVRKPGTFHVNNVIGEYQQRWKPPLENLLKLNVDAAVNNKDQKIGLGVVIRGVDGKVLAIRIKQAQFQTRESDCWVRLLRV